MEVLEDRREDHHWKEGLGDKETDNSLKLSLNDDNQVGRTESAGEEKTKRGSMACLHACDRGFGPSAATHTPPGARQLSQD